jgi:hypothetical protein
MAGFALSWRWQALRSLGDGRLCALSAAYISSLGVAAADSFPLAMVAGDFVVRMSVISL